MYQCYYIVAQVENEETGKMDDLRCPNKQEEMWCSKEHEDLYKKATYANAPKNLRPARSIEEIQRRILVLKQEATGKLR